jgi:hypothetical protein
MGEVPGGSPLFGSLRGAAQYHYDVVESLKRYFIPESPRSLSRLDAFPETRIIVRSADYMKETDLRSSLAILTSVEAAFHLDFQYRSQRNGPKDDLSKAFRAIHKSRRKNIRIDLDPDLFDAWAKHATGVRGLIGDLRGAFKYRHWLAHGRYWTPQLGRKYDFEFLYRLADAVYNTLPLCGLEEA